MKLNKGSILQEVNSNTNSIEFNVKPLYTSNDKIYLSDIIDRINEDIKNITKNVDK
jgi:DNA-binding MarR family transcriptional regulator